MTRRATTRTGLRIGAAHGAPELPAPRGIAPQAQATGYAAPGLFARLTHAFRALFTTRRSKP